jgi:acyl-coenzyme A thioesterase PaaI-like protein
MQDDPSSPTSSASSRSAAEHDRLIALLTEMFEQRISFNQVLGLRVLSLEMPAPQLRFDMRPELVGHFLYGRLHGGVISATLDAMAGLAVMAAIGARHLDEAPPDRLRRFGKLGTIDLRIDYLRPAIGPRFLLHAEVLRLGSRVATTRMEFADGEGKLLSSGSAAYIVS